MRTSLVLLSCMLCACVATDYMGKTYPATTNVDVYFNLSEITRAYETMGEIQGEASQAMSFQDIEEKLVREAMAKGADGIIFESTETIGSTTTSYGSPGYYVDKDMSLQTRGSHHRWTHASYSSQVKDKAVTAKLLKYKD